MSIIVVYARIYASCAQAALTSVSRSLWTLLLPVTLFTGYVVATGLLGALGMFAGIAIALAFAALASSYLYVLGELARDARVRMEELKRSFGAYFWAVLNVAFIVWIVELLLGMALARSDQGPVIMVIVHFAELVLLNATPEVIYQRGTYGGVATIQRSISFIQSSWIEWFIPNLAIGAVFYFGLPALGAVGVPSVATAVLAGALLHFVMVFRGRLFGELDSSSHRQRMFKYRSER